jgi:hypothetical protein
LLKTTKHSPQMMPNKQFKLAISSFIYSQRRRQGVR